LRAAIAPQIFEFLSVFIPGLLGVLAHSKEVVKLFYLVRVTSLVLDQSKQLLRVIISLAISICSILTFDIWLALEFLEEL